MPIPGTKLWRAERDRRIAEAAFARERADRATDMVRARAVALSGSFRNADRSRLRPGPRPVGGSGQAHRDRRTRDLLRKDCQDTYRNNPIARAIVDRKTELVVGNGAVLQVQSEDADFNAEAERLFAEWSSACDLTGRYSLVDLQEQAVTAWHTDGRGVWLKVRGRGGEGVLQVVEDERLRNPHNAPDSETHAAGVELDSNGTPVRFHVATWQRDGSYASTETTPYAARDVIEINNPRCRVANVIAPEPSLSSVLDWLELIDECVESTTLAYRIATLFGFIQFSEDPSGDLQGLVEGSNNSGDYDRTSDDNDAAGYAIQPATGWHLKSGGKVEQLKPEHPTTGADKWMWMLVQAVAAEVGLPIDLTHFVFDRNWSGSRSRLAVAWRAARSEQRSICRALTSVSRWKIAEWINDGRLWPVPGWDRHMWVPAPMLQLNPAEEIKTRRDAIDSRLMDFQEALDETGGGDWFVKVDKLGAQFARLRELGIEPVVPGQQAGANAGDQTPQGTPEAVGT